MLDGTGEFTMLYGLGVSGEHRLYSWPKIFV